MKSTKLFLFTLVVALVALAATTIGFAQGSSCETAVVTESDVTRQAENTPPTDNWVLYTRAATPGVGAFVAGPEQPPLGVGSLNLKTLGGSDKVFLFNFDHVGTKLADINKMGYSTYRTAGNLQQVTSINMVVDENGAAPGGFTTLVFEPVYNTDQGAVVSGEWQTWDAYKGGNAIWWSSRAIPGVCAFSCYVTWNYIVANNPDAVIVGGYGVNQGSGNPTLDANVDALSIGTGGEDGSCITYNFDPFRVATNKDQCKNGGYNGVKRADGSSFKNQGDCVSYVSNGK
ncbi:MAG: hypothetical protein QOE47_2602 [Pyrinomonadaceae bacterium]|jgi:hypothetical protein|nr:hypothetical protein [Pyrinomonadaceae bacterium]